MGGIGKSLGLGFAQLFSGTVLRILLKSIAVTLVVFVAVATAGWYALDWALAGAGLEDTLFAGAGTLREALSLLLALVGLWLTWRIVAMGVVQFFADDVVEAVERRHYPTQASTARELPFGEQMRNAGKAAGRALLFNLVALPFALILLFTGVGTFLVFWLVNALLLGRELQDMVWLRHSESAQSAGPVKRRQKFVLGAVISAMLAVPFLNFLAPVLGAASATHLVHRSNRKNWPA
ncbi:MAG: EI24 domain-containing protein [Alteraurantiacibacter sp.]